MIRFRADQTKATPVECAEYGHPHKDADGYVQYDNSHFDDEGECWRCVIVNAQAGVHLAAGSVREARKRLAKAEAYLVEQSLLLDEAMKNRKKRERKK